MRYRSLLVAGMVALALPARAQWYAGPMLMTGVTDQRNITDVTGTAIGIFERDDGGHVLGAAGVLGFDFNAREVPFSVELSANWRARHDMNVGFVNGGIKSNVETVDAMVSALYDIPLGYALQPYIGGGVGLAWVDADTEDHGLSITDIGSKSRANFAWQLQGGLKYPLNDDVKLRVDYRYVDLGEVETPMALDGEIIRADLYSHDVRLGVTFNF